MREIISDLVEKLGNRSLRETSVINWGSPIISFGNPENSTVATLGLNPSNKEFVDDNGNELPSENRRFETLDSLCLDCWEMADDSHLTRIYDACLKYFKKNPYDLWFKSLDKIISGTNSSYYHPLFEACHLDLVPFATEKKWSEISPNEKAFLFKESGAALGLILKSSTINLIVLNGRTVVNTLGDISNLELTSEETLNWILPRKSGDGVKGFSYRGLVSRINGIDLGREISVLGYNHNIQSSFGVTTKVRQSIRNWIAHEAAELAL